MINAIDFHIVTKNNTLRESLSGLAPDPADSRVLNKEYRLNISFCLPEGGPSSIPTLSGSIKYYYKDDATILLNKLKTILLANDADIEAGSYMGYHYCGQVEDGVPFESCTRVIMWSRYGAN